MSDIKDILIVLENELHQFTVPYQKQIDEAKSENKRLHKEISALTTKSDELQKQLSKLIENSSPHAFINERLLTHIKQLSSFITTEIIDDLCLSSSKEDTYLLLFHLHNCLEQEQMKLGHYILELLTHNPNPFNYMDQESRKLFDAIFDELLLMAGYDNEHSEKILEYLLKLIAAVHATSFKVHMTSYLKQNLSELFESVSFINEPQIIMDLLKVLTKYELKAELREIMISIVQLEWPFLDANVSQKEFKFFLWYAYLFDLDQKLIDSSKECVRWLHAKENDFSLYIFLHDCVRTQKLQDQGYLDQLIEEFQQDNTFTEQEIEQILQKVKSALNPLIEKALLTLTYMKEIFTLKKTDLEQLIIDRKLQKHKARIPLYKSKHHTLPSRFINLNLYTTESMTEAFLSLGTVKALHQKYQPEIVQVADYKKMNDVTFDMDGRNQAEQAFQWPDIHTEKESTSRSQEQLLLNENSQLKELGYQITGLTRAKRWTILQKAVPLLGLKKTVDIIAYNIRLRKGQREKFQYALGEWEYDLEQLKNTYYKNNFVWPRL